MREAQRKMLQWDRVSKLDVAETDMKVDEESVLLDVTTLLHLLKNL